MDTRNSKSVNRDTVSSILPHIELQKGLIVQGYNSMKSELETMRTLTKQNTDLLFDICIKSTDDVCAMEMERLNARVNSEQIHDAERTFSDLRHRHQQLNNLLQEQLYNLTPYGKGIPQPAQDNHNNSSSSNATPGCLTALETLGKQSSEMPRMNVDVSSSMPPPCTNTCTSNFYEDDLKHQQLLEQEQEQHHGVSAEEKAREAGYRPSNTMEY